MASSDDRFREMFYEEARELLISLEEGLMELERRQGDRAHLDQTFRAAHSLKGAAAMVGLGGIAEFTHGIEAVLEKIRGGGLEVDSDIITTLLESRDHLAAMVEGEAMDSPIPGSGELTQRLNSLLATGPRRPAITPPKVPEPAALPAATAASVPAPTTASAPPKTPKSVPGTAPSAEQRSVPPPSGVAPSKKNPAASPRKSSTAPRGKKGATIAEDVAPSPAPASSRRSSKKTADGKESRQTRKQPAASPVVKAPTRPLYRIRLTPGNDTLRRGVNPLGVLDELRDLGETSITTDPDLVPHLDELDPERCYLSWTITVETDADPERLGDVFLFVAEDSTVQVERQGPDGTLVALVAGAPAGPAAGTSGADPRPVETRKEAFTAGEAESPAPTAPSLSTNGAKLSPPGAHIPGPGSPAPAAAIRPHARIRVDAAQLDDLVGLAGELAVLSDNLQGLREVAGVATWLHALESLQRVSRQVRDTTLDLRMVPVDELFSRFPRVIRDLADKSGKEIELRIVGQETRLDRTIVERLNDPMIHLIRNAVDHALETPEERLAKGKARGGRITLTAGHEGDRVAIRVEDDGRGLDREKIVRKGMARGMVPQGTSPDDPRVVGLIFEPGFSTREQVSELSGRGVGLDVVRDSVRALRGSLAVESSPGKGTSFIFRLPLTLALIDGLLVETAGGKYVVPLAQVEECVSLNGTRPALAQGRPCVSVRGELIPMISLRSLFQTYGQLPARQELLLTRHGGQRVGIAVDRLVGRVQAVIQSLGEGLHGLGRFSGATILGDGTVSLILDLSALVSESRVAEHSHRATPSGGVRAESFQ